MTTKTAEPRLTLRRLRAMESALNEKLAGEIDDDSDLVHEDYEAALAWVHKEIGKRES